MRFLDLFITRAKLYDHADDGGGPPAGYNPDSEDTPPLPGDDEGLQDLLDFAAGKPQVAQQIAERSATNPDRSDDPDPGPGTDPAAGKPQPSPPPPPGDPAQTVSESNQQEEILTAEKITEYGLDPKEFKPGDRVVVTFEEGEEQQAAQDKPADGATVKADTDGELSDREKALMAALNGAPDVDWDSYGAQQQGQTPAQPSVSDQQQQPPAGTPLNLNVVTSDDDVHRIMSSADEFNKFATDLMAKGAQLAIRTLIPQVRALVPKAIDQNLTVRDFFAADANADLIPIKKYFSQAMGTVASKEPALLNDLSKLIETTAKVVRKQLNMNPAGAKPVARKKPAADNRPYVVRKSAQMPANKPQGRRVAAVRQQKRDLNSQDAQIAEMLKFAESA